jgi:hypothetical protein
MDKQEIHDYLSELRDSGETNMWFAAPYLEDRFGMSKQDAKQALLDWIQSFNKVST